MLKRKTVVGVLSSASFALALGAISPVSADSALTERYIVATQSMGENMLEMIESCAPGLDTSEVHFDYTPRMREAVSCIITNHVDQLGYDQTVALVEQAEAMGQRSFASLHAMASTQEDYPLLSSEVMIELTQSCGTVEASQDLPMGDLMRNNMDKMAACFAAQSDN